MVTGDQTSVFLFEARRNDVNENDRCARAPPSADGARRRLVGAFGARAAAHSRADQGEATRARPARGRAPARRAAGAGASLRRPGACRTSDSRRACSPATRRGVGFRLQVEARNAALYTWRLTRVETGPQKADMKADETGAR